MGYGGPYAYFATHEKYKRNIPEIIIGVTKDAMVISLRMAYKQENNI